MNHSRLKCTSKYLLKNVRLKHGGDPDSKFIKKQLAMGIKVEMEHSNCPVLAKQIAKAHLSESPRYYTYLESMEKLMKKLGDG